MSDKIVASGTGIAKTEQRRRNYISPSSLALFYKNPEEHYVKYISPNKPADFPQNQPMSIGSAFDAFAKNYLFESLFGKGKDPKFELTALFEAQVEPHNRDWAWEHGKYCFEQYKSAGCLADLMTELKQAQGEPRFEFDLLGVVGGEREPVSRVLGLEKENPKTTGVSITVIDGEQEPTVVERELPGCMKGVPFLGKPDCHFHNAKGASIILDFKVNGYCSKWPQSPKPGYLRMRSEGKFNHGQHKKCHPMMFKGMLINIANKLNDVDESWAAQLSIYAWLLGEPIGSEFIVGIDQLSCNAVKYTPPQIRIAEHRALIDKQFQINLFEQAAHCWEVINSDHQFRDMSKSDSQERCAALDGLAASLLDTSGGDDAWLAAVCRGGA